MDNERNNYIIPLALKGVSAMLAALNTAISEGAAKPTDEMVSEALYMLEVVTDQVTYDIEQSEKKEIERIRAISQKTGIPMNQLFEL